VTMGPARARWSGLLGAGARLVATTGCVCLSLARGSVRVGLGTTTWGRCPPCLQLCHQPPVVSLVTLWAPHSVSGGQGAPPAHSLKHLGEVGELVVGLGFLV
jgi:hypothetical protein